MNDRKIASIIKAYRKLKPDIMDGLLEECKTLKPISTTISVAAGSTHNNKKHGHQLRIPKSVLKDFGEKLQAVETEIDSAKSFDEIIEIVRHEKIEGIGELAIYDIAQRIAASKQLYPDKIYLHSGTRIGARNLGVKVNRPFITKADLPAPFQDPDLTEAEIEDILCIYKERLATCK